RRGRDSRRRHAHRHPLPAQPPALRLQPPARAAARRQRHSPHVHERQRRPPLPRVPPSADVLPPRLAPRLESLPLSLQTDPDGGVRPVAVSREAPPKLRRRAEGSVPLRSFAGAPILTMEMRCFGGPAKL